MNLFEEALASKLGAEGLDRVQGVKIGIAGAGGLGSNCALNLVRCGFKSFVIADLDVVDQSNLDRQFYFYDQIGLKKVEALNSNLLGINPDVHVEGHCVTVTKNNAHEIFSGCQVIVEAFDKAEDKRMIAETFITAGKFVVSASGICGIGASDDIKTHRLKEKFILVGDLVSDSCQIPPISPRVNIAAAKQADIVLEYVLGGLSISREGVA